MIIVRIKGGLGNQMFQYAMYKALLETGKEVKLDNYTWFDLYGGKQYIYNLEKIFDIEPNYATAKEISLLSDLRRDAFSLVRRRLCRKGTHIIEKENYEMQNEILLKTDDAYLDGYWQSEKYFEKSGLSIRNDFTFKANIDWKNKEVLNEIKNGNSVAIHIRRGDYQKNPQTFGKIFESSYYKNAISYMKSVVNNPNFFVFSDDIEWVSKNIKIPRAQYINHNNGEDFYKDMLLMSKCKHNIIANSTFSWWSGWLNDNPKKIVLCPSEWEIKGIKYLEDIVPDRWTKITTN